MKALSESLELFAPPPWLIFGLAIALAATLLTAFVDTLQDNARKAEQMWHGQRVGGVRHVISSAADATAGLQKPHLQQLDSQP